jgi:hypothetical protein
MGSKVLRGSAVAALAVLGWSMVGKAQEPDKTDPNTATTKAILEGSVRGMAVAGVAAKQDEVARANWKKFVGPEPAPALETPYLLIHGTVPNKSLKETGATLEKQMELARSALKLEDSPWPGKLTVYLLAERPQFTALVRGLERRNPESEETGSLDIRRDQPHVIAGPPRNPTDPGAEHEAGILIAGALLAKKGGPGVPEWVVDGFGRATVMLAGPKNELMAEHRKASAAVIRNKRRAKDIWEGNLSANEAGPIRASMIEYLAFSKRFSRFDQLLAGFRVEENRQNPTTLDALKAANVNPDKLNSAWQTWVKAFR